MHEKTKRKIVADVPWLQLLLREESDHKAKVDETLDGESQQFEVTEVYIDLERLEDIKVINLRQGFYDANMKRFLRMLKTPAEHAKDYVLYCKEGDSSTLLSFHHLGNEREARLRDKFKAALVASALCKSEVLGVLRSSWQGNYEVWRLKESGKSAPLPFNSILLP